MRSSKNAGKEKIEILTRILLESDSPNLMGPYVRRFYVVRPSGLVANYQKP